MTNLLYICRANLNRSPVAEKITQEMTKDLGFSNLSVKSAGLIPANALEMTYEMKAALKRLGYKSNSHTPRILRKELLSESDLILCMSDAQAKKVKEISPESENKIYNLPRYGGIDNEEVSDPNKEIGKVPTYPVLRHLPKNARKVAYHFSGHTDHRDYELIKDIHTNIATEIETYVDRAIKKMTLDRLL